jgi:hypothetical protein
MIITNAAARTLKDLRCFMVRSFGGPLLLGGTRTLTGTSRSRFPL